MCREYDESVVRELVVALHELSGRDLSIYLDRIYDKYPHIYHILLGDAVEDIEDCSEDDYRIIEDKLGQMGNFGHTRVRSMIEYSDEDIQAQVRT